MPKIRVQCRLDDATWARIDALRLTPGASVSGKAARERDVVALVTNGLEALEAARDAAKPPPDTEESKR
jgi:hypothetical protein